MPGNSPVGYGPPPVQVDTAARVMNIIAIVLASFTWTFCGGLMGFVPLVLAIVGRARGDRTLGTVAIVVSAISLLLGGFLGLIWLGIGLSE